MRCERASWENDIYRLTPTKAVLYGIGLMIASAVMGFVTGMDFGTPVYDIAEVVYTANPHRMRALDGVVCYFEPRNPFER